MRIVHISTYDLDGGAARAAYRSHELLIQAGHQSTMLVRTRHSDHPSVIAVEAPANSDALFGSLIQEYYLDYNRTDLSTTCFSLDWPGLNLISHPAVQAADIIHLHWISQFVSTTTLAGLQRLGKPVVWTLHDQRAYTGGCHYTAGCRQFEQDCAACPQLASDPCQLPRANVLDQAQANAANQITVIAPSRWMADCARRSRIFRNSRIELIPYGIDPNRFKPWPQTEARTRLVLPHENFFLLFGVDNAREKRKGVQQLFAMLQQCSRDAAFLELAKKHQMGLLCFGEMETPPDLPIPIRQFGRIRSDTDLNLIYSSADLFLLPSLEDNLPNTVLESMFSGTPVAAYDVGGIPDMVLPGRTGYLAPAGDFQRLGQIIQECVNQIEPLRAMRTACRLHAESNFSGRRHAQACLDLYQGLLAQNRQTRSPAPEQERATGSQFERVFAPVLKFVFDCDPKLPFPWGGPGQPKGPEVTKLKSRLKKVLKRAVKSSWGYAEVREALEAELEIWQGTNPYATRTRLLLKRWLGMS